MVLEKAFHEDHANGGKGALANGGCEDCAQAVRLHISMGMSATDFHLANAFVLE
jgi:hypothetical protein